MDDGDQMLQHNLVVQMLMDFNTTIKDYKSPAVHIETFMHQIEQNGHVDNPPHYFQTVLACSLLKKAVS